MISNIPLVHAKVLPSLRLFILSALTALAIVLPSFADDTEIFFGQSDDAFETNPNILFVLDISGSMIERDGTTMSRMDRMKNAMRLLVEQSSNFNVGVMTFQGREGGAAVRYPIGDLDSDSTEMCPDGVCQDELLVVRPGDASDDASQNDDTLEVFLNNDSLIMGLATEEQVLANKIATKARFSNKNTTKANGVETVTRIFSLSSSVKEKIRNTSDQYDWQANQVSDRLFVAAERFREPLFGYQFANVNIPPGATIVNASIKFTLTDETDQSGEVSAYIVAEQTAEPLPLPITGSAQNDELEHTLVERNELTARTNEIVPWNSIPGTIDNPSDAGNVIFTPDLSGIVSELVNLPSWANGNTMSFLLSPTDSYDRDRDANGDANNVREVYSAGSIASLKPVLSVTFEKIIESEVQISQSTATSHIDEIIHENSLDISQNTQNSVAELFYAGTGFEPRDLAIRFENMDIPPGAVISSANLTLRLNDGSVSPDDGIEWVTVASGGTSTTSPPVITGTGGTSDGSTEPDLGAAQTDNVSININSELSAYPLTDTATPLRERAVSTEFVAWADVANGSGVDVVSPNLASVIDDIIALDDWKSGNTISLILSASGDYVSHPNNIRQILTSNSSFQPTLDVRWTLDETNEVDNAQSFTTALRFRNVHVPPGATISSAELVMSAAGSNAEEAIFDISGELIGNSEPYTDASNNIGARQRTQARETYTLEPWVAAGNEYTSVNVASVIKEITSATDWCGGNALSLFVSGTGNRFAQSFDSNPTAAPSLRIQYEPSTVPTGSYCSNSSVVLPSSSGADDGSENLSTGAANFNDVYLSTNNSNGTAGNNALGFRFRGLALPPGAAITSATLEMTAVEDMANPLVATIAIENVSDAAAYATSDPNAGITARNYGASTSWNHPGGIVAGETVFTNDISALLTAAVNQPGWEAGNSIALKLSAISGSLNVASRDGDESTSPTLIVYYQSERNEPGIQNRGKIQQVVDELYPTGATPIVEALYEAGSYLRGDPMEYGRNRGTVSSKKRWYRVSHEGSYEGGTHNRPSTCSEADLNSTSCSGETIQGAPVYISPLASQCQSNHIVLLSDGGATSNNAIDRVQNKIGKTCDTQYSDDDTCGREFSEWLRTNDFSNEYGGKQFIKTHTIGFNLDDPTFLQALAVSGGGTFEPADSASELLTAFKKILNNVSRRNASFVAPSAAVSQFNRLRNRNDVYYSMFKPAASASWDGNLKRYEVGVDGNNGFALFDSRGNLAIDENTGAFNENAKSFWSSVTDGDNVEIGGAAEQLQKEFNDYTLRRVYTYTGTSQDLNLPINRFSFDNPSLNRDALSLPPLISTDDDQVRKLMQWSRGRDLFDEDGDGNTVEVRDHMGDPMHSTPVIVNYADGESVIYISTNEGFLHALDTDTGREHFSFIPEELMKNLYKFYRNETATSRPYGLDGGKMLWHDDTNENGVIETTETAILYVGMRRGGDSYFALDVSNYRAPRYLWSIKGGRITSDLDPITGEQEPITKARGNYEQLASTWSLPVKTKIIDGDEIKDVIIFGGGYDPNQDPAVDANAVTSDTGVLIQDVRSTDSIGKAIYIADAKTGKLIWRTTPTDSDFSALDYSIPSQIRTIDIDFDGLVDQAYFGDMGGQLWRMDFDTQNVTSESLDERITGGRIAEFAGDDAESNRKFYYPPSVSVINVEGQQLLNISIGSGWRAHPLDNIVKDRLYNVRSPYVFGPPIDSFGVLIYESDMVRETTSGMIDVTDQLNADIGAASRGWFLSLEETGEKILGTPLTFNGQILVTSYLPDNDSNSCDAAIGSGALYGLNVRNGAPVLNLDEAGTDDNLTLNDRYRYLNNAGLPPEVSVLFPEVGDNDKPLFQVGKEIINELEPDVSSKSTFWQEATEDHD